MLRSQYFSQQILSGKLLSIVIKKQKSNFTCGFKLKIKTSNNITSRIREGNGVGRDGVQGWGLRPRPTWFCLTPSLPHPT